MRPEPIVSGVLGIQPVNPIGGARKRMARDLAACEDSTRIFEVIIQLWPEFARRGRHDAYREAVNGVLAEHGIAWDFGPDGRLDRVLPAAAQAQVAAMFEELSQPQLADARESARLAKEAYDDRSRRDRDACVNIFAGMEAAGKARMNVPNGTFGDVLNTLRQRNRFAPGMVELLTSVNALRNRTFAHGMPNEFAISAAEVDFTYLVCVAGTLMFARMR